MDQRLFLRLFTLNGSEVVFAFITLNGLGVEFEINIPKESEVVFEHLFIFVQYL